MVSTLKTGWMLIYYEYILKGDFMGMTASNYRWQYFCVEVCRRHPCVICGKEGITTVSDKFYLCLKHVFAEIPLASRERGVYDAA